MLDELVVETDGKRYIGHLWGGLLARPLVASQPLRWRFAYRGQVVAEFPATPLDTAEAVKARLLRVLSRMPPQH